MRRIAASVLLFLVLSTPAFAAPRPTPNSPGDDSPIVRVINRVVKAIKHLTAAQPLDDAGLTWPKP